MIQAIELLRVGAFLAVIAAIYAVSAVILARWIVRRRRATAAAPAAPLGRAARTTLAAAALGVLCILYGWRIEPFWLEVSTVRIESSKLPRGAEPLRVVQISDLHCDAHPRLETELPDVIAALEPDIVVFTGDCANSPEGVPVFKACLSRIAAAAPTYAVKGNWDCWFFPEVDRFGGTGAVELDGDVRELSIHDVPVRIGGVAMDNEEGLVAALERLDRSVFTMVLFHPPYPEVVPRFLRNRVDLLLTGHVHGGQVALPVYGALLTLSRHGKRYERGLYDVDEMKMYVNRGIGMEGGNVPRVRFCARPEVTLFEVVPQE